MPFLVASSISISHAETLDLRITGLNEAMLQNAEATLDLPPGLVRDGVLNRRWLDHYRKQIPKRLASALEPFGFYHATAKVELRQNSPDHYLLLVEVDQGPPVILRAADITVDGPAATETEVMEKLSRFPLKVGDVLRQDYYDTGKRELRDTTLGLGYLTAEYSSHQILIYPEDNIGDIDLELVSGPQFHFGQTLFSGADDYPTSFLRRFLAYRPGQTFTEAKQRQTRANFQKSGRFQNYQLIPRTDIAEDGHVPVEIHLESLPPKRFRTGIGYGDNSGPRLTVNFEHLNVFSRGHEFRSDMTLGQKSQSAQVKYIFPQERHIDDAFALSAGLQHEKTASYESESLFSEGEQLFSLGENRVGSVYLRFQQERHDIYHDEEVSHLLLAGARLVERSFQDPVNPRRGYHYRLEMRGCAEGLLSDISLLQMLASSHVFRPLGKKFFLLFRFDGGYTIKESPFDELPPSLRFFVGGDNSVRGYAHKSEGPRDADGNVIGGEGLLAASLELEREIHKHWGVAAFYDIGSAFNSARDMDFISGAGVGLRIYTPIGPIKIDLAHPLEKDSRSLRLHLGIGFEL
ncbi:MAG: outer membrane protein assembly factor [Desulfuromonadaceae bacterium]|nr:outer membrane protein assembly factor [Desulfuromonadaceae bacterium]